jgi:hypothetical protein
VVHGVMPIVLCTLGPGKVEDRHPPPMEIQDLKP